VLVQYCHWRRIRVEERRPSAVVQESCPVPILRELLVLHLLYLLGEIILGLQRLGKWALWVVYIASDLDHELVRVDLPIVLIEVLELLRVGNQVIVIPHLMLDDHTIAVHRGGPWLAVILTFLIEYLINNFIRNCIRGLGAQGNLVILAGGSHQQLPIVGHLEDTALYLHRLFVIVVRPSQRVRV
jgi:hypothetical protein